MTRRINRELVILLYGLGWPMQRIMARCRVNIQQIVAIWARRGEVIG